ncbi:MAG TPA: ABC transporter permease, partial [Longimicrobiales bacterium]|nr:ABC transporter permease [Longimicrobiales bacterium]
MLTDADDQPGVDPVALISHEIWQTRYESDPAVVGRTITLNSMPVTVAGVLEPGFALPGWAPHFWLPRQLDRSEQPQNSHMNFITYGRLRDGVTPEQARIELEGLKPRMTELFPTAYSQAFFDRSGFTPVVHPLRSMVLGTAGREGRGIDGVLWVLLGAVSLVLLIACANVANLMLVRAEMRRRELAVRAAMGAERAHMAVHYLVESALLSVTAALLGLGLAWAGIRILVTTAPATLPRLGEIGISSTAVLFAAGLGVLTALIFGMAPVLRSGTNFSELRESGRGSTPSRERQLVRSALVVGQVGMALVLLAAGALMLRSFMNLQKVDAGIDPASVLTFTVTLPYPLYSDEPPIYNLQRELVQRVEALPGVELVSATSSLPLSGGAGCSVTVGPGTQDTRSCVPVIFTLPGYFEALDIPVRGTAFGWQDVEQRRPYAVISRALAERMWPGEDPLGKQIISYQTEGAWFTIVGVADDVLADGLDQPPTQAVYYPTRRPAEEGFFGPHGIPTMRFVVETGLADPTTLAPAIRSILRDLDPEVPLADIRTMEEVMMASERMARTTFTMMLLGIAAVIALFLSAVGLYGVIAYLVGRRRAEIGVRMALGARVSQVARLVVLQSVRLALVGVVIGIAAAFPLMRFLSSLVWGVEPTDTITLAAVSALLIGVAVLASAIPARRAALTPPSDALRAD